MTYLWDFTPMQAKNNRQIRKTPEQREIVTAQTGCGPVKKFPGLSAGGDQPEIVTQMIQ